MKRGESGLSLLLGVNKPPTFTSHDVVNTARKVFGERRVGHGGTLDPFATGVLPIMVGPATRMASLFSICEKEYIACISFGKSTTTDDLTGEVEKVSDLSSALREEKFAKEVLSGFVGEIEQVPPKFSAIKVNGKRAYSQARKGEEVTISPRKVNVYSADLLDIEVNPDVTELCWRVKFTVGSGTYIRSLARDIGEEVGCPAHLSSLCRMSVGGINLNNSIKIDELYEKKEVCSLDPCKVLPLPTYFLDSTLECAIKNGAPIKFDKNLVYKYVEGEPEIYEEKIVDYQKFLVSTPDVVLGVYVLSENGEQLKAETVFNVGVSRCHHKL